MNKQLYEAYRELTTKLINENKQLLRIADNVIKRGRTTEEEIKTLILIKEKKRNPKYIKRKWEN